MERKVEKRRTIPKKPQNKRVAAYARVSTGKDAMIQSLSAQVSHYQTLIQERPDWDFAGIYADEAISGTKNNREQFIRMVDDALEGKINMIITKSITRFARNTVTLLSTSRILKEHNVDVYFEKENIHTISAEGELMLTLLASFAQEESRSASENQKWRVIENFKRGDISCLHFMFGYDIDKENIKINKKEAEIVKGIYKRFLEGESLSHIAKDLRDKGIRGHFGGKWDARRIRELLENEKYTGNALFYKHYNNNYIEKKKTKNKGELPMFYARNTHEAIIDEETFNKVQRKFSEMREADKDRVMPKRSIFTSMIKCKKCGKNYKRGKSTFYTFFNCSTFLQEGKDFCQEPRIPEDKLYAITEEVIGIKDFTREELKRKVDYIEACDKTLVFYMKDGQKIERTWEYEKRPGKRRDLLTTNDKSVDSSSKTAS